MHRRYTRREFIAGSAQLGAALGCAPLLNACSDGDARDAGAAAAFATQPPAALPVFTFSEAQRRALTAAVARLIPAQGDGDWSAADAGAVEYIEQFLNALSSPGNPKIYGDGPERARFANFTELSRAKLAGWTAEILRLREHYVQGLDELNRLARGPLSLLPGDFAGIPAPAQDGILQSLDLQGSKFFAMLFAHTMEGVYSHPVYGGNRDYIAWDSLCYQGDVHGVRFPSGHDPLADDRPWDKFGGYAPEEMIQPGNCSAARRRA